jgi:DNA-binding IclR family transcriptional regulator
MANDRPPTSLKTTVTSIEVLEILEAVDGATVSEIAERMDKPKSTIHGHLATLKEKMFVIQKGDLYYIGPELLRLGNRVRTRESGFVLARKFTERLFEASELRSIFAVEMGGKAVFLHTASGNQMGWSHEQLGNQLYLHNTAVGKAILARLPQLRVDQIIDRWGLPQETENTITDQEELFAELETVREQGYAVNRGENFEELYGIGCAATRQSGDVIGGFSVTGPEHAILEEEGVIAQTIKDIVNEYELELALA